jgi:decaprenyl-phosphate phosphoribosyltransferase
MNPSTLGTAVHPSLQGHLAILRIDHWIKNIFVLPGILVAFAFTREPFTWGIVTNLVLGFVALFAVVSSYYTLNELLDAPYDRHHPVKCRRPVPAGRVHQNLAYAQWLALGAMGISLGWSVNAPVGRCLLALWVMGCLYNIPPIRLKDVPYFDVLSEAVNNPLRLLLGWYLVTPHGVPPASLLLSYWFLGAYFMAIKRFAEFREIGNRKTAADYRRSFAWYTEQRLLTSILFYASASMLLLGAFTVRYRLELILAYPLVALVMAVYFDLAFNDGSAAQAPEKLYREPRVVISVAACVAVAGLFCFWDLPYLHTFFAPTLPISR